MKVKFLKDHEGYEAGDVVWIADEKEVQALLKKGVVELVAVEPEKKPAPAKGK
jgi:hypothetical protein